jgi:hypothetical protein
MPSFKSWEEVDQYLEKKYGIKSIDRTKELEGKAIVFFPGMHTIQNSEDE